VSQPDASTWLKQGIAAAKAGNKPLAQQYLLRVVELQPENESSWLWLAITAGSQAEQIGYLQQLLAVNPDNKRAAAALRKLEAKTRAPAGRQQSPAASPPQTTPPPAPPIVKQATAWRCPLCQSPTPRPQAVCPACRAVLDPEQISSAAPARKGEADDALLLEAIYRLKNSASRRDERAEALYWMGIAYLNLGQMSTAVSRIQAALQLRPQEKTWRRLLERLNQQVTQTKAAPPASPKRGRVMIVDDSLTIRKLVGLTLERKGYDVITAVDGIDALAKLSDNVPDLILLDITMPRMDGYQLCKVIKSNDATQNIPVIMLSGKDGFFDKIRGRVAGSTDYITKPFEPQLLAQTVEKYIHK